VGKSQITVLKNTSINASVTMEVTPHILNIGNWGDRLNTLVISSHLILSHLQGMWA